MSHWASEWLIPIGAILTATAALFAVLLTRRQIYWDNAPIIEIDFVATNKIVEGPHLQNKPATFTELDKWNEQGSKDYFLIAEFTNKQPNAMGVATKVMFEVEFIFPHPEKHDKPVDRLWRFGNFWLRPKEKRFGIVIANLRGLPLVHVDILRISYYDIRGRRHTEARGFCRLKREASKESKRWFIVMQGDRRWYRLKKKMKSLRKRS